IKSKMVCAYCGSVGVGCFLLMVSTLPGSVARQYSGRLQIAMNVARKPDYSDVLRPGVAVDVAANMASLIRGAGDPTAVTLPGVSWLSFTPAGFAPVTVAIEHPASKIQPGDIRYHVWAND